MLTLIDNEWITVELVVEQKTLKGTWKDTGKQMITLDAFQDIFNTVLQTISAENIENWADDTTDMGIVPVSCQKWMVTNFFPKAITRGLKKVSIINSKDIFASSAVKNVLNKVSKDLQVETFESGSTAMKWMATA